MVGGFGQLPRVGVARDVSTQVSLALLLTSTSQPKQCPSSRICFYVPFGKELTPAIDRPLHLCRNWELKLLYLKIHCHVTDSTLSAQLHIVRSNGKLEMSQIKLFSHWDIRSSRIMLFKRCTQTFP